MYRNNSSALAILLVIAVSACSTTKEAADTMRAQGKTLIDLQYRQALDNLAMFRKFGARQNTPLPWNLKFSNVTTSVTDAASPSFSLTWPGISRTLSTGGTGRVWQIQWSVTPETNPKVLAQLQAMYAKAATGPEFSANFEEGPSLKGALRGEYDGHFVWPKDGRLSALNALVLEALTVAPIKAEERNIFVPLR